MQGYCRHCKEWNQRAKTFDGSILCTTHMEFDVKGKKLWSNQSDATENILALFKFSPL